MSVGGVRGGPGGGGGRGVAGHEADTHGDTGGEYGVDEDVVHEREAGEEAEAEGGGVKRGNVGGDVKRGGHDVPSDQVRRGRRRED